MQGRLICGNGLRRTVAGFCAICGLFIGYLPETVAETTMNIGVEKGNIREDASLKAKINAQLERGEAVTVLESRDHWYRVQLQDGETGWAHESVLVDAVSKEAAGTVLTVTIPRGNVRKAPSVSATVETTLKRGDTVEVLASLEDWHHVLLPDGRKGWVHRMLFRPAVASAYRISGIRIEDPGTDEQKIYFGFDGVTPPRVFLLKGDAPRVVCDFKDTGIDKAIDRRHVLDDTLVKNVRIGIHDGMTRVVLDLAPGGEYRLEHIFVPKSVYELIVKKSGPIEPTTSETDSAAASK